MLLQLCKFFGNSPALGVNRISAKSNSGEAIVLSLKGLLRPFGARDYAIKIKKHIVFKYLIFDIFLAGKEIFKNMRDIAKKT